MSNPFEYFKIAYLQKYATFKGRASKKEFWYFILFAILLQVVSVILFNFILRLSLISLLFYLSLTIPGIAVTVRRLHDTDHSSKLLLFFFLRPISTGIEIIKALLSNGTPGLNRFGPNPNINEPSSGNADQFV